MASRLLGLIPLVFTLALAASHATADDGLPPVVSSGQSLERSASHLPQAPLHSGMGVETPMPGYSSSSTLFPMHVSSVGGAESPFAAGGTDKAVEVDSDYDRILDLYEGNDRDLIQRVREAVAQTEVGEDVADQEWITVRGGERVSWGGRIETDTVGWVRDEFGGQQNYVEFRRLRLMASGKGYGVLEYQLELSISPDLEDDMLGDVDNQDDSGFEIKDAFIAIREMPLSDYTIIGHFRTPIGLSNLTSSRFIPFMERSLPSRLMPGRELGIASFNASQYHNTTWSYGIFFHDLDENQQSIINDNQGVAVDQSSNMESVF